MTQDRRLTSDFDDADQSAGLMLWRVTNVWQAAQRATLRPFGLTHVQFVLLASLTWLDCEGPVTQQRLAGHAGTDPMMTSQILRVLEQRELIERRPHPSDRRAKALVVTSAGADLANRANRAVETCDSSFFGPLGAERATFALLLRSLVEQPAGFAARSLRTE